MNILRRVLTVLLLLIFIPSSIVLAKQLLDNKSASDSYESALEIAQQAKDTDNTPQSKASPEADAEAGESIWVPAPVEDDDPYMKALQRINLDALREVNSEVVAWVMIPDTNINYPVLHTDNNQYYLDHTWDGEKNTVGAIFMEHQNSSDFSDYNTIIYGHNMGATGEMFDAVEDYKTIEYLEAHPYIYIVNDDGVFRYDIFASYATHVESDAYGMVMNWDKTRQEFLDFVKEQTHVDSGIEPGLKDQILTLSTCYTYEQRTRWVIQARLKMMEVTQ